LQEVGNAKRGAKSVAFGGTAEVVREDSLTDEADNAADENSGADEECGAASAGRSGFRGCGRFQRRCANLFDSFTRNRAGGLIGGDFAVSCQRAYSFILLRSVL
jgi:hypothetical protein